MARRLLGCVGLLCWGLPAWGQVLSYDLFQFQAPRGWKLLPGKDEYGMERVTGGQFCQIALYRALPSTGNAAQDFDKEWDTVKARFTIHQQTPRQSGQAEGWTVTNGAATVEATGTGRFVTSVQVYSGFGLRASVVLNMNYEGCKSDYQAFLGSLRLVPAPGPTTAPPQAPIEPGNGTWVSSAEANPELGAWPAEFRPDYVQFAKSGMTVRVYHAITITDPMRSRGDMRENVWNLLVAPEFRAGQIRYWDNGPGATGPYSIGGNFLTANATETRTGAPVTVGMNYAADNGLLRVVVAYSRDPAIFARLAGTPELINKLQRLNMFLVPPAELNGRWTTSINSAAETYSVATGNYTGLVVGAASFDITFENGKYQSRGKATVGRIGALSSSSDSEAGTYQHNGSRLTLSPQGKERTDYLIWFEAVRGGMMLHMLNDRSRGLRWDLLRAK